MKSLSEVESLSARRAWIEISSLDDILAGVNVALRKESVDRNIRAVVSYNIKETVALRKESVDRNKYVVQCRKTLGVALRKESVDRNRQLLPESLLFYVALRKESVDRNLSMGLDGRFKLWSLSARRAWIEIGGCLWAPGIILSLSARRAWIEIEDDGILSTGAPVALRKESVDRNSWAARARVAQYVALRKESVDRNSKITREPTEAIMSLSARRAWIEIRLSWFFFVVSESLSARRAWIEISDR